MCSGIYYSSMRNGKSEEYVVAGFSPRSGGALMHSPHLERGLKARDYIPGMTLANWMNQVCRRLIPAIAAASSSSAAGVWRGQCESHQLTCRLATDGHHNELPVLIHIG